MERSAANTRYYFPYATEKEVKDYIRNSSVFIAESDGKAIGTVSYQMLSEGKAEINGIIVRPEFRGQGIAQKSMDFILNQTNGIPHVIAYVHPKNMGAIKLYWSKGLAIIGFENDHYGDGEPRLVMERE